MTTLAAFLLLTLQDAQPLPKIAELSAVSGSVEIVSAAGASRRPARFGTRLRNAEIRDEDRVKTGEGSQAVILFPDASKLTVKEKSEVQILQKTLPKPTPEGNTVGRRIKILFGELTSEVIPNKDVRTDFDMQIAGSAAVRGTLVGIVVSGGSATLAVSDGTVRFLNGKYATYLDVVSDQRIRFTEGSLIIEVLEDGGQDVVGQTGSRRISLNRGNRLKLDEIPGGGRLTIENGPIKVDGDETTASYDFAATPYYRDQPSVEGGMPTGAPVPDTGDSPATDIIPYLTPPAFWDTYVPPVDAVTILATSPVNTDIVNDNFARGDSSTVGNAWSELIFDSPGFPVSETGSYQWFLQNGRASFENLTGTFYEGVLARLDLPNLNTFTAEALFNYTGSVSWLGIGVNYNPVTDAGMFMLYYPPGGNLRLEDAGGGFTNFNTVITNPNTDFILVFSYDGTTMSGSIHDGAHALRAGPFTRVGPNGDGGVFKIIAELWASGRIDVDDVRLRR